MSHLTKTTSIILSPQTTLLEPSKASNASIANPSLLQKALIKATAQSKQPSPTVLLNLKSSAEYYSSTAPTITTSKFNTTVSVTERSDRPTITSIVNVSTVDEQQQSQQQASGATTATSEKSHDDRLSTDNSICSKLTVLAQTSTTMATTTTIADVQNRNAASLAITPVASTASQPTLISEKDSTKRDHFIRSIGKRLRGKTKVKVGRQKSKVSRKVLNDISNEKNFNWH